MEEVIKRISKINSAKRWDYRFHQRTFSSLEQKLEDSVYPLYSVEQLTDQVIDGTHFTPQYTDSSGVLFLMTRNVRPHEITLNDVAYITHEEHQKIIRCKPNPGDVLVTKDGTIGIAAVVPDSLPEFNIFVSLIKIRPKPIISPHYLAAFINSELGQLQIKQQVKGAAITHIHLEDMRRIKVPLPPRSLQDQIARVMQEAYGDRQKKLEQADKLIASINTNIEGILGFKWSKVEDTKSFLVSSSDLVGARFDFRYHAFQSLSFSDYFSDRFEVVPLGQIIRDDSYGILTPGTVYNAEHPITYVRVTDMRGRMKVDFGSALKVPEEYYRHKRARLKKNDVLLAVKGASIASVKSVAFVDEFPEKTIVNGTVFRFQVKEPHNPLYVAAMLESEILKMQIRNLQISNNAVSYLDKPSIHKFQIPLPPRTVQDEIAQMVQDTFFSIENLYAKAEAVVAAAKVRVERMILSEETVE